MLELRSYQLEALTAAVDAVCEGKNPVVSLPTGSGKSLVLAALIEQCAGRTLVVSHRKELLEQDQAALMALAPEIDSGIYSAGLNRRDTMSRVIFGGVQSIYRRLEALQHAGAFAQIIVDEAHLVSRRAESMYGQVLEALPGIPRIGLTATPYRLDTGVLHEGDDRMFDDLCIHVKQRDLTPQYLAPLVGVQTKREMDVERIHQRGGDFIQGELNQYFSDERKVAAACEEIVHYAAYRSTWIVFCCGVQHAEMVTSELQGRGVDARLVTGETAAGERAETLSGIKAGTVRALVNVDVASTGFDAPNIDCVVSLRPTLSKGLWVQQLGRGGRLAPGKENCIAEGQRVLTNQGLVPIECVTKTMTVWDGCDFVSHDGIIFQGEQEVITYAGLTCTPDHQLWTGKSWKEARECSLEQTPISVTGMGKQAIRETDGYFRGSDTKCKWKTYDKSQVRGLWANWFARLSKFETWIGRVQKMRKTETSTKMVGSTLHICQATLRESIRSALSRLWWAWDQISIRRSHGYGGLDSNKSRPRSIETDRQDKQRWALRAWESKICGLLPEYLQHKETNYCWDARVQAGVSECTVCGCNVASDDFVRIDLRGDQSTILPTINKTKRRVWDILNAGPRHRFTVEGILVSNCLVLDFSGNCRRHGDLDLLADYQRLPELVEEEQRRETERRAAIERHIARHGEQVYVGGPTDASCVDVERVRYYTAPAKKRPNLTNLVAQYTLADGTSVRQWVCVEYDRGARWHAEQWFKRRGADAPTNAREALVLAKQLPIPESVSISQDGPWPMIDIEHWADFEIYESEID